MTELFQEIQKAMDSVFNKEGEFSQWLGQSKKIQSFIKLPGDASTRKYYRIVSQKKNYILMSMEPFLEKNQDLAFISLQSFFQHCGVDVPKIFHSDPQRGLILLEDLGDVTLLKKLQNVDNKDTERLLYEQVIDALVKLQLMASRSEKAAKNKIEAFQLRFDHEKLFWEINHTIENFYKIYLKRNIEEKNLKIMQNHFSDICQYLSDQPTVLVHRDFHSRNIMVCSQEPERFVMIDFQDARMGPAQYDLSSLLRDSYYQLEESQVLFLIDYYISQYEKHSLNKEGRRLDRDQFIYTFDLMSIQRNFKAIGSFASFFNKRGDPSYLKFIGNTFENIRRTLLKYPKYSALREILFHYYYF